MLDYFERAPVAQLGEVIECFWSLRGTQAGGRLDRILPDGCPELILTRGDLGATAHSHGLIVEQARIQLVGQLLSPLTVHLGRHVDVAGVRFQPAGAAAFFGPCLEAWTNRALDVDDIEPGLGRELEGLLEERDGPQLMDRLEALFLARILRAPQDRSASAVSFAVDQLLRSNGGERIDSIADSMGKSTRQLLRIVKPRVGVTPKELARILRFQSVFKAVGQGPGQSWVDVALRAGYCDQAHLNRDFRDLAGDSPPRLMASAGRVTHVFTRAGR